ncbi:MAG TPA: polyamine aminopropyltransferase [Paludibacteraceae bacterium]|nr:polyamine aminopropyltransferase [Paludibacteraceae bacterium]HRR62663.1 polyamine aminopropyltransferase [Paludibacteraceae bacterium]
MMLEKNYPTVTFNEYDEINEYGVTIGINKIIYSEQTKYQKIDIFETKNFGKIFTLDGIVMTRDSDEFIYHEMISHVPLFLHDNPKNVLVIGGGDGGTVREVLKHSSVEKVTMCELDEKVVEASKKYLPNLSYELTNPKVKLIFDDGSNFIKKFKNKFDVIIIDSTDPTEEGGGILYTEEFYRNCSEALTENGVFSAQTEEPFLEKVWMNKAYKNISSVFNIARLYMGFVPAYFPGTWTWTFASKNIDPIKDFKAEKVTNFKEKLKYYNEEIHIASFALPNFVKEIINVI